MSEDFDKEAEREKLREQFERDEKRRQATRKMSDLLLKGATMTNKHCDQCGSPIFRYEGQEFCPECQTVVGGEGGEGAEMEAPAENDDAEPAPAEDGATPETPDDPDEPTPETGPSPEPEPAVESEATAEPGPEPAPQPEPTPGESTVAGSDPGHPTVRPDETPESRQPPRQREPAVEAGSVPSPAETGDLAEAQASLREALTRFADRAAETDDPRQAREYLVAAREAAEALAALRR